MLFQRLTGLTLLATAACAHAPHPARTCDRARDARAIRALAGTFAVQFAFDEHDPIEPGYALHAPYRAKAREVVKIIEDDGQTIVLQHLLIGKDEDGKPSVMKHWREDWIYEDPTLVVYSGHDRWRKVTPSQGERRCAWSQAVYEVDDRPRYEALGTFTHDAQRSTWTATETWRPLPRREYTKRDDYDVLIGVNTIVIDATGWTHGQDNLKWVSSTSRSLVREKGDTRYERKDDPAAAIADEDWQHTAPFWKDVRDYFSAKLTADELTVHQTVDGTRLYEALFPLADELARAPEAERKQRIATTIAPYVQ